MRKILYILCLLALSTATLRGQSARPLQNVPTPEAAGLGLYGSIPVGLFTGIPDISVPLHEMVVGKYRFPISVSYHLASVKPNNQEGILGMGWHLLAGGCINRTVRGLPDEHLRDDGHASGFYAHYGKMKNITAGQFIDHTQNIQVDDPAIPYELSADEFSFRFGEYSGNFYLNEDGGWDVVSDHDIKVRFDGETGFLSRDQLRENMYAADKSWGNATTNRRFFNTFTLVAPDGREYEFGGAGATEYSAPYYARNTGGITANTWYLTRVVTPEGWQVSLDYEPSGPTCSINYSPSSRTLYGWPSSQPHQVTRGKQALTGFLHFPVRLKTIRTPNETINFKYAPASLAPTYISDALLSWVNKDDFDPYLVFGGPENPADQFHLFMRPGAQPMREKFRYYDLHAMEVTSTYSVNSRKTYYFDYVYNKRKKLSLVTERAGGYEEVITYVQGGGTLYPKYQIPPAPAGYTPKTYRFEYNTSPQMPLSGIANEDSWGYYHGGTVLLSALPSFDLVLTSPAFADAEVLLEMEFPTRGKVRFEYEPHRYHKVVKPSLDGLLTEFGSAGGLRVSSITALSEENRVLYKKKYHYAERRTSSAGSGILRSKPVLDLTYYTAQDVSLNLKSANWLNKPVTNQRSPDVGYSCVIEETLDSLGISKGYVRHRYTNFDTDIWGESHLDEPAYFSMTGGDSYVKAFSSRSMERGKPVSEEYFDADDRLIKSVKYRYGAVDKGKRRLTTANQHFLIFCPDPYNQLVSKQGELTYTYLHSYLPDSIIETSYENGVAIVRKQAFTYNSDKLLRSESVSTSRDEELISTHYLYPGDIVTRFPDRDNASWNVYDRMARKNILDKPVEIRRTRGDNLLSATVNEYKLLNGKAVLYKVHALETTTSIPESAYSRVSFPDAQNDPVLDARMKLKTVYGEPDCYGNPLSVDQSGVHYVYLWGYNGQYPVAEIRNSAYREVKTAMGVDLSAFSASASPSMGDVDALRDSLPDAYITTYTYKPATGITSVTDPSGKTTRYVYDTLGRLKDIYIEKSGRKEIIETYEYNYTNQQQ